MFWNGNAFLQANAAQRSRAGFDTFIERQGGLNCCPWCAGLVGVFAYPKGLPKEVFARHDNCTCSVTYGTKGGARQHVWSKQTWSSEQEREYLRLTDEAKHGNGGKRLTPKQIAAIREKVQAPRRLTKEQAAALGAFAQPRRLTGGAVNIAKNKPHLLTETDLGAIMSIGSDRALIVSMQYFANRNIPKMSDHALIKSIESWRQRIIEHKSYIDNPIEHCENWNRFDERYQKGLIHHWKHEIKTLEADIKAATEELERRGAL